MKHVSQDPQHGTRRATAVVSGLLAVAFVITSSPSFVEAQGAGRDRAALLEAAFDGRVTIDQLVLATRAGVPWAPPAAAVSALQAAPSLEVGSASGVPGDVVTFAVTLHTGGAAVAGVQNDLEFDSLNTPIAAATTGRPDCAVNPSINKGATSFAFRPSGCSSDACTGIRALVLAVDNVDPIPDGAVLYTCTVNIAASATAGDYPLEISYVIMSDPEGNAVPDVTGTDGAIFVSGTPVPPANDNFADAELVAALPLTDSKNIALATLENGEPVPACAQGAPMFGNTIWYAFTPMVSGLVTASSQSSFSHVLAVYTGASVTGLQEVNCLAGTGELRLSLTAEMTYYFQIGALDGMGGRVTFSLETRPDPLAMFYYYPGDPSVFDTVQFYDASYDPAGVGIASQAWDFGDGTTAEFCCPTHRYAADGDYTVALTVTTFDGRVASTSQVVPVRTHDVAITKFSTPQAARAGQTRQITVGINSKRQVETVTVELYKSVPGGYYPIYQLVGVLTQQVPVRPANRTTAFSFDYTFTSDDRSIGKVTFWAVAWLQNARDALPADNEAISAPTKVN